MGSPLPPDASCGCGRKAASSNRIAPQTMQLSATLNVCQCAVPTLSINHSPSPPLAWASMKSITSPRNNTIDQVADRPAENQRKSPAGGVVEVQPRAQVVHDIARSPPAAAASGSTCATVGPYR